MKKFGAQAFTWAHRTHKHIIGNLLLELMNHSYDSQELDMQGKDTTAVSN